MKINLKSGIDKLLFGMKQNDVTAVLGKPDKNYKDEDDNVIFYFDPPYYLKASTLYMNHYQDKNHKSVSDKIKSIRNIKWVVSYDNVPQIQELYLEFPKKEFSFKHTAFESREGKEILFFSNNLVKPEIEAEWNPVNFKLKQRELIYITT